MIKIQPKSQNRMTEESKESLAFWFISKKSFIDPLRVNFVKTNSKHDNQGFY